MTAKEAMQKIKSKYTGMSVIGCFELPDSFVFALTEKGKEDEVFGGGYYTIEKGNGKFGGISSLELSEIFSSAKPIDINTLN